MTDWPSKPLIYEINTAVWLTRLSRHYSRPITLANVPDEILDELAALHVNAIWLMGIWERSYSAMMTAQNYAHEYKPALPDLTKDDIIGSAYAVGSYRVDEDFGGRSGLAHFRQRLRVRGLRLLLDYVPNHVALDHAWTRTHPEYLVLGTPRDVSRRSDSFYYTRDATGQTIVIAHGRDPYFPGWADTAQVNAFSPELRQAALLTLLDIASQCDGVRCDMAMLMMNDVFARTWNSYVGTAPRTEYWVDIIPKVKDQFPNFLFIAEVYWDMEHRLQQQGFDFAYDKRLYDRILEGNVLALRNHLLAASAFQKRLVRFIENHDEERAMEALGTRKQRPAATLICTLPGATLLHDGQLSGRRVKLPVQIRREAYEPVSRELVTFYDCLLNEINAPIYQYGQWTLFDFRTVDDMPGREHMLAYGWRSEDEHRIVVVNLTDHHTRGIIDLSNWRELGDANWTLDDILNGEGYQRSGEVLGRAGLYVELAAFGVHLFRLRREN